MDSGRDCATPLPASAMSVEEAWGLTQAEDDNPDGWNRKKDTILSDLKDKLSNCAPLQLLEKTYPDMEQYARLLWKLFPPMPSHPPYMRVDLPGQQVESLTGADVHVMHLATISISAKSMVCEPAIDNILKLADEILTDGFVTDTEPLILNVTPTQMEQQGLKGIPPWGATMDGSESIRPFSVCHHKSSARVTALHLLLIPFIQESQLFARYIIDIG